MELLNFKLLCGMVLSTNKVNSLGLTPFLREKLIERLKKEEEVAKKNQSEGTD